MTNALARDLDQVLEQTEPLWNDLRSQRLFITGGTGFFGRWLLETFLWANERLSLGASATVLTRSYDAFLSSAPHLASHQSLQWLEGDVRTFTFPDGQFSYVIHAATDSNAPSTSTDLFETIVMGTRHVLEFARSHGARRLLLTSSGAVYGPQPPSVTHLGEEHVGSPDPTDLRWAYGEAKRAAEMLCAIYAREHGVQATVARGFTFVGPYMALDGHFAIGNFIRDLLGGGPIRVLGDGTPFRSYLYASDLAVWLWTILLRGQTMRPYNVGSSAPITIADLARLVAQSRGRPVPVLVAEDPLPGHRPHRYVPAVARAETELGLRVTVGLEEAIHRTVAWHLRRLPVV